ncbi:unnamed protein product [Acanthoscelides obtectus]|uniref:Uncharacterized protein n=1 Tax=Acanthoscelides obtectus TaxID=200917 RepID=A0A9P0L2V4_ACAOB|nr:unnamed protein product [Acanthoscelides obtectus]CAK1652883.1 hypothetical protein AOBTE_LOCUS17954 [Acanthoscelides obtectus]
MYKVSNEFILPNGYRTYTSARNLGVLYVVGGVLVRCGSRNEQDHHSIFPGATQRDLRSRNWQHN